MKMYITYFKNNFREFLKFLKELLIRAFFGEIPERILTHFPGILYESPSPSAWCDSRDGVFYSYFQTLPSDDGAPSKLRYTNFKHLIKQALFWKMNTNKSNASSNLVALFQYCSESWLESSHVGISIEEGIHQILEWSGVMRWVFSALYKPMTMNSVAEMLTLSFTALWFRWRQGYYTIALSYAVFRFSEF